METLGRYWEMRCSSMNSMQCLHRQRQLQQQAECEVVADGRVSERMVPMVS